MDTIPSEEEIILDWNPVTVFDQFENQTVDSHNELKMALTLLVQVIDKYRSASGDDSKTYTKKCNYLWIARDWKIIFMQKG